jgi:tetratricopeptide (TPR) repeat protein
VRNDSFQYFPTISSKHRAIIASLILNNPVITIAIEPTDRDNQLVRKAFVDFDLKNFGLSDKEFSQSIEKWRTLDRPRDEIVSLLKARANVRLDNKQFMDAIKDYNEALELMKTDGERSDGIAKYPEYPDTFVGRALAKEGLGDWNGALSDYNKAIELWGGGRGDGVNPYVLTFRGNTLSRLSKFEEAIPDFEAASNMFNSLRDVARYSDARANLALTLYQVGRIDESLKIMNDVIRKNPGYADMHIALAADFWSRGDYINALKVRKVIIQSKNM